MPAKDLPFSKINLVPKDEFERSFLGKALRWALTAGKSIVIVTEFVVILAFLSRFKFDRDLNDLNEVVLQKQAVVASFVETESRMKDIQARIDIIKRTDETTLGFGGTVDQLISSTPLDVSYDSIDVSRTSLNLKGVAGSEVGFSTLLNKIRADARWTQISLGDTDFNQRKGGVSFTISAKIAEKGNSR